MSAFRSQLRWSAAAIAAGLTALVLAAPASAQTCMEDRFFAATGGHLTCTANDVRIASAGNIKDTSGNPLSSCIAGQTFSFIADFTVQLTAQTRYDIGLYFATDGDPDHTGALKGTCDANIITPKVNGLGSSNFINLDTGNDTCGDITNDAAHNPQIVTVQVDNVLCSDTDGDGKLNLPNCTSWRQPGSNDTCNSPLGAYPGSPSKCNCDIGFNIPVRVETGGISVLKDASPGTRPEPGGEFTFSVTTTNTLSFTSVVLDRMCDDRYGLIVKVAAAQACPVGTLYPLVVKTTTCVVPQTLTPGDGNPPASAIYACSFTADFTSNVAATLTDTVTVDAHDATTPFTARSGNDSAQVAITNVTPTATVVKSLVDLACADVNYRVRVNNTDGAESLTLSALIDSGFGSITAVHDDVLSTSCAVPKSIAANGFYECDFRAHFCGGSHTNTVTATLNDDDGNIINPASDALTVNVNAVKAP